MTPALEVVALGTGTALPDRRRGPTGIALRAGDATLWIDGGSGTLQRSARAGIDPLRLTGGVYTHRHADHTGDLVPLRFAHRVGGRTTPYPILAGEGFQVFLDHLAAIYGAWLREDATVDELPLTGPATRHLGPFTVRTAPARHDAGALHVRIEVGGRAVVFSGDTGPSDALVDLARDADLLICECAARAPKPDRGHLTPDDLATLVLAARPRATWVTHLYPGVVLAPTLRRLRRAGVDVRRARDGQRWTASAR